MTRLATICVLLAVALQGTVNAVVFEDKSFDQLVTEAEQIIIGTATVSVPRRLSNGAIVTDYYFANVTNVKGGLPGSQATLTLLGGTIGPETMAISGVPEFRIGTRYLIFVSGNGTTMFPTAGGPQGIFEVRDTATGAGVYEYGGRPVTYSSLGFNLSAPSDGGSKASPQAAQGSAMTIAQFVAAVEQKMGR